MAPPAEEHRRFGADVHLSHKRYAFYGCPISRAKAVRAHVARYGTCSLGGRHSEALAAEAGAIPRPLLDRQPLSMTAVSLALRITIDFKQNWNQNGRCFYKFPLNL